MKKNQFDEMLTRGVAEIIGREELEKKLKSGKKLRIKHGWDPTASDLHLGYTVPYRVLRRFQNLGHTVIFLVGDFTTSIGDPTDRDVTRPELDEKIIKANTERGLKQIGKILDLSKLEVRKNSEWYGKMNLLAFLKIARHITAVRLWERDMFQKRLQNGGTVFTHEFLYPILQGYDSVMLQSDLTVIGSDQLFNELMGRELQRAYGQEGQAIMSVPILPGTDGKRKMGQSLGNYIGIIEPPEEQYGKIMSVPDGLIVIYCRLLTDVLPHEIDTIEKQLTAGTLNPRDAKMRLAKEIVTLYHGTKAAQAAETHFVSVFQKKELPNEMPTVKVKMKEWNIVDLIVEAHLASSKNEARRLIAQKGVMMRLPNAQSDTAIDDPSLVIARKNIEKGFILKRGKRHFVAITV